MTALHAKGNFEQVKAVHVMASMAAEKPSGNALNLAPLILRV
jgi:hypothetical protein